MNQIKIELELPESLYSELQHIADSSDWPLNKVLVQTIRAGMPPTLSKVPQEFHDELLVLNKLTDQELLKLAESPWDEAGDRSAMHKRADFKALQRTYAWSLLRWRGHPVPTPFEF
jgi:hypothetical protein